VSVLKLSVMWNFQFISKLAASQVFRQDVVDPLTKVLLARDYGLSRQLLSSLCQYTRQGIVKAEDADALGLDYFLKILEVQERIITAASNGQSQHGLHNRKSYDFTETLRPIFQEEIDWWDRLNADFSSGPERASSPTSPVQLEGPEKDDRFFPIDVFFLVSCH
jgi:hypothetical protein